jgi:hypothetical protein
MRSRGRSAPPERTPRPVPCARSQPGAFPLCCCGCASAAVARESTASPRVDAEKTRFRLLPGGPRLSSQRLATPLPRGEPPARSCPLRSSRRLEDWPSTHGPPRQTPIGTNRECSPPAPPSPPIRRKVLRAPPRPPGHTEAPRHGESPSDLSIRRARRARSGRPVHGQDRRQEYRVVLFVTVVPFVALRPLRALRALRGPASSSCPSWPSWPCVFFVPFVAFVALRLLRALRGLRGPSSSSCPSWPIVRAANLG